MGPELVQSFEFMGSYSLPLNDFMGLPVAADLGRGGGAESLRDGVWDFLLTVAGAAAPDGGESVVAGLSVESVVSSDGGVGVGVEGEVAVVLLSASVATAGFNSELNCVTCCGVPNPGAPNADSIRS